MSTRTINRHKRFHHTQSQEQYINNLPDVSVLVNIEQLEVIPDQPDSENGSQSEEEPNNNHPVMMNRNPPLRDYVEVFFSAILSRVGLNLKSADQMVNLINNLNRRFSENPIVLPNIRYFWEKRSRSNDVNVYILCDQNHAHGPFIGEPKNYKPFNCNGRELFPELKENKYFIHLPLRSQLETHLPSIKESFWQRERFHGGCDDVSNGIQASKVKSKNSIGNVEKLTLTLHADEVVAGNSSSIKIFPIFVSINELRPLVRRKHFFLVSLFVGKSKPPVETYLNPVCQELLSLETDCVTWFMMPDSIGRKATFHTICLVADAPMRAYMRNVGQYNHLNGCDWCLVQASTANGARVFPNLRRNEIQDLYRKKEDFLAFRDFLESRNLRRASNTNSPRFRGIFGLSPLLRLTQFDIVNGISVEPMHSIILGILRGIVMRGWLGDENIGIYETNFNKTTFKKELSARLVSISVPDDVNRIPRDLDQVKFWKSAEFENFLAYYCMPTIKGLLKPRVINHLSCLVRIYQQASYGSISEEKLQEIGNLVEEFQQGLVEIYGPKFLTYNLHILSHLSESMKNLGPCGNVSSYPLEGYMGILKEKVRRSSNIAPSLVRTFISDFKYNEILENKACNWNLTREEKRQFGLSEVDTGNQLKITSKKSSLQQSQIQCIMRSISESTGVEFNVIPQFYQTISVSGTRYSSRVYCRDKQRSDSILKTKSGEFFSVEYIICGDDDNFQFCGQQIRVVPVKQSFKGTTGLFSFNLDHVLEVKNMFLHDPINMIVPLNNILGKCIFIESIKFHYKYSKNYLIDQFLRNK